MPSVGSTTWTSTSSATGPAVHPSASPTTAWSRRATTTNGQVPAGADAGSRPRTASDRVEHLGIDELSGGQLDRQTTPTDDDRRLQRYVGDRDPPVRRLGLLLQEVQPIEHDLDVLVPGRRAELRHDQVGCDPGGQGDVRDERVVQRSVERAGAQRPVQPAEHGHLVLVAGHREVHDALVALEAPAVDRA